MSTRPCRIVFIGAGSFLWTWRLVADLFSKESLRGSQLILVDTDSDALSIMHAYCREQNERMGVGWSVQKADLAHALPDADHVIVSISVGGLEAFDRDYHIPEEYGVYHTVGDTVGPGGISRTLRNVPVFLDIARQMERLCPKAWMVHVTNPLAQITRAVCKASSIRTVGLCHNFEGTMGFLAQMLDAERDLVNADSFGVNHFTFLKNPTCDGKNITDRLTLERYFEFEKRRKGPVQTQTTDDDVDAMTASPLLHNKDAAEELTDRLLEAQKAYLPQFQEKS